MCIFIAVIYLEEAQQHINQILLENNIKFIHQATKYHS